MATEIGKVPVTVEVTIETKIAKRVERERAAFASAYMWTEWGTREQGVTTWWPSHTVALGISSLWGKELVYRFRWDGQIERAEQPT